MRWPAQLQTRYPRPEFTWAIWFTGGSTTGGHTIGATDEVGAEAVENVHHIRDMHITWLHLLGLDDNK